MKKLVLSIAILLINTVLFAQSGSGWEWSSTSGNANAIKGIRAITTDASGNIYVTGGYNDSLTLGVTTLTGTPAGSNHGFVGKYDKLGNLLWVTAVNDGLASTIAIDADGNSYIGGNDRSSTTSNIGYSFAAKYDNNGNKIWYKIFTLNEVIAINVGPDSNPIVIDEIPGNRNIYKLNKTDGSIIWTVINSGAAIPVDSHQSYSDFLDSHGNVYYTLYAAPLGTSNTPEVVAGKTINNPGGTFLFVSVNNNGNLSRIDSANNSYIAVGLAGKALVSKSDKVYLTIGLSSYTGGLSGTNQSLVPASSYFEMDTLGKVTSRSYLTPFLNSNKLFSRGNGIYSYTSLRGGYGAAVSFGDYSYASPASTSANLNIIVKYDPVTYQPIWANSFETTGTSILNTGAIGDLDVTPDGKVIVGGNYGATVKFGATLKTAVVTATNGYTKTDLFLAQFDGAHVDLPPSTTWTGAANNMDFNDPANWNNGVPNGIKTVIPGGLANYPNNISASAKIGKLQISSGATITLPITMSIPSGIINDGRIILSGSGIFYGGFNSGQTHLTGHGRIVINSTDINYFGFTSLDNSLEINAAGKIVSFGGSITGSLYLTKGILGGGISLTNPDSLIINSDTSFVEGNLTRAVHASGIYNFPVGNGSNSQNVSLLLNNLVGPKTISVNFNPTITGALPTATIGNTIVSKLLNSGIWTITPDVALTSGNYQVTIKGSGFTNNVTDASRYVIVKRANSAANWAFYGSNGPAVQTTNYVTAIAGNISGFSDFAIGIADAPILNTLPVTYISFQAVKNNKDVSLNWQTSHELNNNYFNVQHSNDAHHWNTIGKVKAGSVNGINSYEYQDLLPENRLNYYRLEQVDMDGKTSISEIRTVDMSSVTDKLIVYPNPLHDRTLHVSFTNTFTTPLKYSIIDISGKVVRSGLLSSNHADINIGIMPSGIYNLQIENLRSFKFVKN